MPAKRPPARKTPPSATSPDPVTRYARAVGAGKIAAGPLVRAACERHLHDLDEGPERGLMWDRAAAARVIGFFRDVLRLADGEHAGRPFVLQPWQQFIIGSLFGWKGADGYRRFRNAYIEVGKGAGKSPMAAGIGLYMLLLDDEKSAEVYAAAVTREQAKILFRDAVKMVEASPALARRIEKSGRADVFNLAHSASGSFFRPISSEGRGLDGKRVHCGLIDEVHEHRTSIVVDKIRAGTKGRRQALIVQITNSGYDRSSICWRQHEYSARLLNRLVEDDGWFAYVASLDGEDDWRDPKVWIKANPNLGVSIPRKYLAEQVREAQGMPAKESIVRRLNFCEWVDAANPAIDGYLWRAAEADFDESELAGLNCVAAIDLSGTRDLTALACIWEPDGDGIVHAIVEFWTPEATIAERARQDQVPYDQWVRDGWVHATPGRSVDYAWVAQRLSELQSEVGLRRVAFDPYRIKYLERDLDAAAVEVDLVPHGQGYFKAADSGLWMPRSVELLEDLLGKGRLRVKRNPALAWCAASAVHIADPKGNRIYDKRKSTGRIDGLVALAMAVGLAGDFDTKVRSIYDDPSAWDDEPRTSDDGMTPDQAILADPRHSLFHEHRQRFEARLAMNDEDW